MARPWSLVHGVDADHFDFRMSVTDGHVHEVSGRAGRYLSTTNARYPDPMSDVYRVEKAAFRSDPFSPEELAAMQRHVRLANDLGRCRYFTEEVRSLDVTLDKGVTTSWEMTLPDAGATRDMVGLLRQLFGDKERGSFASMIAMLRIHADTESPEGQRLLEVIAAHDDLRQRVLNRWDLTGGQDSSPRPPLNVFLDWLYGEYLHSDADRAERIEKLNTDFRIYEWQFHWIAERLAFLYARFAKVVGAALKVVPAA